jgi:putative aminopeptidase FrvX
MKSIATSTQAQVGHWRRSIRFFVFAFLFLILSLFHSAPMCAQTAKHDAAQGSLSRDLVQFVATPAVSGYESGLVKILQSKLAALHPATDNLGDITVTIGTGAPHRLIVTPMDEPGFVVSEITPDGYLRVQRLPQFVLPPIFNSLYSAQPVRVGTASGKWIDGVVAGLSVHLQPGHTNPPKSDDLENMYIDIGASSAAEARKAGVDLLSPIVINRQLGELGYARMAGASIGDRFGAAALVELLRSIDASKVKGTLTVAFVVQQWTGARGLQRVLSTNQFDDMVYVGRLFPGGPIAGVENIHRAPRREPGSGVLIGVEKTDGSLEGLASDLQHVAGNYQIPVQTDYSTGMIPPSYLPPPSMPAKWAHIGIAVAWPATPAELIDSKDLDALEQLLQLYAQSHMAPGSSQAAGESPSPSSGASGPITHPPSVTELLRRLVMAYGSSYHEGPVRNLVLSLLPKWGKPETDDAGNVIVRVGTVSAGAKTPKILVVAHMDEIGIDVKSISKDGRLEAEWSGGEMSFYAGHQALVHTATGDRDAIYELPNGWDEPKFEWPRGQHTPIRIDVGARTSEEVEKLRIKVGDSITIPKAYRPLLGTSANGRSFDDRVGCTALISAAWALGGPLKDRDVTFVFSTGEEIGLVGAGKLAARLAAEGHAPDYVFAVDTFVSSDSPLENKRFADAQLGKGFVVRAVDNSNIVPRDLVEKVVKLAAANHIPVQYGVTGGGNDGSAFVRYGSVDVALGWPLRYSHSPAEVVDTRDVDALGRIVTAIARSW